MLPALVADDDLLFGTPDQCFTLRLGDLLLLEVLARVAEEGRPVVADVSTVTNFPPSRTMTSGIGWVH